MTREQALELRALIEEAAAFLSDEQALRGVVLYPAYQIGKAYAVGDRFNYEGVLYKVTQAHTSQVDWVPGNTPALYVEVTPDGVIGVWKRPTGAHDAYNQGDKVYYPEKPGNIYRCLFNGNVYSPDEYPAGWELVSA